MTEAEKARRLRASTNYRSKRSRQGESQVQIWLPAVLREKLDEAIKSKGYKNRSEAITDVLSHALEGDKM